MTIKRMRERETIRRVGQKLAGKENDDSITNKPKLFIDNQAGSKPLIKIAKEILPAGVVRGVRLQSADATWYGTAGKTYAVEVKHLSDILKCIDDGRFVSQLRRMQETYDHYWLLLVDEHKCGKGGLLEFLKVFGKSVKVKRWMQPYMSRQNVVSYDGLIGWLTTMEMLGGCRLWHVQNDEQAAAWIVAKYRWSQKKKHKSLDVFDRSRPAPRRDKKKGGVRFIGRPNEIAKVANAMVDKIGWEKAKALSYHFGSVEEFMTATRDELMEVKGIGKTLADKIIDSRTRRVKK